MREALLLVLEGLTPFADAWAHWARGHSGPPFFGWEWPRVQWDCSGLSSCIHTILSRQNLYCTGPWW